MTGDELIEQFERSELPGGSFHHADHVRLAFEYLTRYSTLEALEKFSAALKRFAEVRGKAGLYHETVTWAFLFLIRERMTRGRCAQTWQEFSAQNEDLFVWRGGILDRLYRKETLDSELARSVFLLPDRNL